MVIAPLYTQYRLGLATAVSSTRMSRAAAATAVQLLLLFVLFTPIGSAAATRAATSCTCNRHRDESCYVLGYDNSLQPKSW